MALDAFKPQFDNAYQEVFQRTLVAKDIMNTRFESVLKYGASIARVSYDISGVLVRTVTRGAAVTPDSITDSSQTLLVEIEKEAVFHISDGEVTQAGPLNPGEVIGKQVGHKVALDLDGRCFAEIRNALYSFDNGDLTTGTSTGTAITLNSTTVPQMTTRLGAKLRNKNNQEVMTNMALVVDSYAASDVSQFIISKNIDLAGAVFKNGYAGDVSSAQMYISENLPCDVVITSTGVVSDNDTITINGVVLTMKTTLGSTAGNVLIGANAAATITNLAAFIDAPTVTTAQGVALTVAADIAALAGIDGVATSATVLTLNGTGTGRIIVTESLANFVVTSTTLLCYYGKKGAIDLVIQDLSPVDMRITADRRGTNVFSSYLAGIKTFSDGAKKFLQVKILVA